MEHCPELELRPDAVIMMAAAVLLVPLRFLAASVAAAVFHEFCHIVVLNVLKKRIYCIEIGTFGARIETENLSSGQEWVCAAAGPVGSLSLLLFLKTFPELAICGLVQGIWNLLPLYPSDGGRILRCMLLRFYPKYTDKAVCAVRWGTVTILWLLLGWAIVCFSVLRPLLICMAGLILLGMLRKIPCNKPSLAVQ